MVDDLTDIFDILWPQRLIHGDPEFIKSLPPPDDSLNRGPVRVVVASTFREEVAQAKHDVLISFSADWCSHCKELEPVWEKLGEAFERQRSDLVLAKYDGEHNSRQKFFRSQSYPTIYYVRKTDQSHPILFEQHGNRTIPAFLEFIVNHTTSELVRLRAKRLLEVCAGGDAKRKTATSANRQIIVCAIHYAHHNHVRMRMLRSWRLTTVIRRKM